MDPAEEQWHLVIKDRDQLDMTAIYHHFAGMFEIHRHPSANIRLNLPKTPIGLRGMPDHHPRFQKRIHHSCHSILR